MRAQHTTHSLPAFPIYSCAFISDDLLVAGGGGGASRSGIKNKLRLFRISVKRQLESLAEFELDKDEDAPMSMAAHIESRTIVCGINSAVAKLQKGENENCRKFLIDSGDEFKFTLLGTRGTISPGNSGGLSGSPQCLSLLRLSVLSSDAQFVAVGSERELTLLSYEGLSPVTRPILVSKGEIYDATLSATHLILATSVNLLVYALPATLRSRGKEKNAIIDNLHTPIDSLPDLQLVKIPGWATVTFRASRLHPSDVNLFYSVINVTLPRAPKAKTAKKQAYILKWRVSAADDVSFSAILEGSRKISEGSLTCFDVSPNGKLLAFGVSDYSLGILDANSLAPLLSILKAHEFPITALRFNPSSKLLVSGGVDSSIRIVAIPEKFGGLSWSVTILIMFAILGVILAVMLSRA
ncbi:WD40-repeat-containing domain protein [Pisolithus microcarpus]|nr:WD40-repeat-containing domain protein [Pisolithus microcarpus]